MASWRIYWNRCKSRLSAISRHCYLSRERWRQRCRSLKVSLAAEKASRAECEVRLEAARRENEFLRADLRERAGEIEQLRAATPTRELPFGSALSGQSYPVGIVTLCVNLARKIGLRPTVSVLTIFFDWLGVPRQVPSYQTIRTWMQRIGLDRMQRAERVTDGIWLADHSMQIGTEKVLVVLRIRESRLPPKGTPLRHEDTELLCCRPGKQWKREDVLLVYQQLAAQYGQPLNILTDGAVELREPAEMLVTAGKSPLVTRDLKHFLANRLEGLLARNPPWQEFMAHMGQTRAAVQQTEVAHFTPPSLKPKARFMNLQSTLAWAKMVLWHLEHLGSRARQGVAPDRMESKFAWLRQFDSSIKQWYECQRLISQALTFFNQNGVFRGACRAFQRKVAGQLRHPISRQLLADTVQFVCQIENKLQPGQRMPTSTEILESTFALYKQLERQHAKGGFTSLLPAFGTLLKPTTTAEVTQSFARVKIANVNMWITTNLPVTLASLRQTAYREASGKKKPKRATQTKTAA